MIDEMAHIEANNEKPSRTRRRLHIEDLTLLLGNELAIRLRAERNPHP